MAGLFDNIVDEEGEKPAPKNGSGLFDNISDEPSAADSGDTFSFAARKKAMLEGDMAAARKEGEGITNFTGFKDELGGNFRRGIVDPVISLAGKGSVGVGQSVVGLVDIATAPTVAASAPALWLANKIAPDAGIPKPFEFGLFGKGLNKVVGYDPKVTDQFLDDLYSDGQKAANQRVHDANGFWGTVKEMIQNPSTIAHATLESIPQMGLGQGIGGAVGKAAGIASKVEPFILGALGEGITTAGNQVEGVREDSEGGTLTPKQLALGVASGLATGLISVLGGKIAKKLEVGDLQELFLKGKKAEKAAESGVEATAEAAKKEAQEATDSVLKRIVKRPSVKTIIEGGIEGGEESLQSMQEQVAQNLATGKPAFEGVLQAGGQGLITGAAMGLGHSAGNAAVERLTGGAKVVGEESPAVDNPQPGQEVGKPGAGIKATNIKVESDKLTPSEWAKQAGITVIDPDGWRVDKKDFSEPISQDEFNRRVQISTVSKAVGKSPTPLKADMESARRVADMTPDEFFNQAKSFNRINLELGENATDSELEELKQLRDKATKRAMDAIEGQQEGADVLASMPQFYNEAIKIAEDKRKKLESSSASKQTPSTTTIATGKPNGTKAEVVDDFIEADEFEKLINRQVNEAQTRQREGNSQSDEQIIQIATNPDLSFLGRSDSSMFGAPVVGNNVEAGNGRGSGIVEGYKRGTKGIAEGYKQSVVKLAGELGRDDVASMKQPVHIRRIVRYVGGDRASFVTESNPKYAALQETIAEQGLLDADALGDLSGYELNESGTLSATSARIASQKLTAAQRGVQKNTSGEADQSQLNQRFRMAALAKMAKSNNVDASRLTQLIESEEGKRAFGEVVKVQPLESGLDGDLTLSGSILNALEELQIGLRAVADGNFATIAEWLSNRSGELIKSKLNKTEELILGEMVKGQKTPTAFRDFLKGYYEIAKKEQGQRNAARESGDIFGEKRKDRDAANILIPGDSKPTGEVGNASGGTEVTKPASKWKPGDKVAFKGSFGITRGEVIDDNGTLKVKSDAGDIMPLHDSWKANDDVSMPEVSGAKEFTEAEFNKIIESPQDVPENIRKAAMGFITALRERIAKRGIDPDTAAANSQAEFSITQRITGSLTRLARSNLAIRKGYKRASKLRSESAMTQINGVFAEAESLLEGKPNRIKEAVKPVVEEKKPAEPTPKPAEETPAAKFSIGSKVQVGKSPQMHTIIAETTDPRFPDEKIFKVREEKSGKEFEADAGSLRAVKELPAEDRAKGMTSKAELNATLKSLGLAPSSFPDNKSKREAIRRAKAKGEKPVSVEKKADEPLKLISIKRAKNFDTTGEYVVSDGKNTANIYRDPESKYWYDAADGNSPTISPLSTENREEAIKRLQEKWAKKGESKPARQRTATDDKIDSAKAKLPKGLNINIRFSDDDPATGNPAANGDVATIDDNGDIVIHRKNLERALSRFKSEQAAQDWLDAVMDEEAFHGFVRKKLGKNGDGTLARIFNAMTAIEKLALIRSYTGISQTQEESGYEDSQLGHEVFRRVSQRIRNSGRTTEIARSEGWSEKLVQHVIDLLERIVHAYRTTLAKGEYSKIADELNKAFAEATKETAEVKNEKKIVTQPKQETTSGDSADTRRRNISLASGERGGERSERPKLRVAGEKFLPTPTSYVSPDEYSARSGFTLDEHQTLGVNLALDNFIKRGGAGFMLADGTGFGKTAQIIAIADQYVKRLKKPVLIVTQNRQIIEGSFTKDSGAMGVSLGNFEVGTYDDLRAGKIGKGKYGLVIYDEAHNLKNADSQKTLSAAGIETDHSLYATATPLDRPSGASYFLSKVFNRNIDLIRSELGFKQTSQVDRFGNEKVYYVLDEGMDWAKVAQNIANMRDKAITQGAMVRREYPFWGKIETREESLPTDKLAEQEEIESYWDDIIESAMSPTARRNYAGQKILELSRWTESQKIEHVWNEIQSAIKSGQKLIIIAEGINKTKVKGLRGVEFSGLIGEIEARMDKAGIDFARIYGDNAKGEEVAKFQGGKTQIAIATPKSGGTGINLDDYEGDAPRKMLIVTPNFSGDVADQINGRISRKTTKSESSIEFLVFKNAISDARRQDILKRKLTALRNIQNGTDLDIASFDAASEAGDTAPSGNRGKQVDTASMPKLAWQPFQSQRSGKNFLKAQSTPEFEAWLKAAGGEKGISGLWISEYKGQKWAWNDPGKFKIDGSSYPSAAGHPEYTKLNRELNRLEDKEKKTPADHARIREIQRELGQMDLLETELHQPTLIDDKAAEIAARSQRRLVAGELSSQGDMFSKPAQGDFFGSNPAAAGLPPIDPPIRWTGGKRWLAGKLRAAYDYYRNSRLVEPFFGSGAVTLGLRPSKALVNDINPQVINLYKEIQKGLVYDLKYTRSKADFLKARSRINELISSGATSGAEMAKLFYYMNRAGMNGLWRVNSKGFVNTPYGFSKKQVASGLRKGALKVDFSQWRDAFRGIEFQNGDFNKVKLNKGDFVYADPPYWTQFGQKGYDKQPFTWEKQVELADWLAKHDGAVVISNSDSEELAKLYKSRGFKIAYDFRQGTNNSDPTKCEPVRELIAYKNLDANAAMRLTGEESPSADAVEISKREWWHVKPQDEDAYSKRGKFYSSSYKEAEFYGIAHDAVAEKVEIQNPLIGDESFIENELLGKNASKELPNPESDGFYKARTELDAKLKAAALRKGYDAIALLTPKGFEQYRASGKIPKSVELNTFNDSPKDEAQASLRKSTITPEIDAAYLKAAQSNDEPTMRRLVDEAAKRAGYTEEVFRSNKDSVKTFDTTNRSAWFTGSFEDAADYDSGNVERYYINPDKFASLDDPSVEKTVSKIVSDTYDLTELTEKMPQIRDALKDKYDGIELTSMGMGYPTTHLNPFEPTRIKSADLITRDDAGNIIPLSERFNPESDDIRYSLRKEQTKNLVAAHNTTAEKLRHMIKMGGLPVPSIAIIRPDKAGYDSFGNITLVGNPDLVTPSRDTKVLNADAYSPRYPTIEYFPDQKGITAAQNFVQSALDKVPEAHRRSFSKYNIFNEADREGIEVALKRSPEMMLAYLAEKGQMPEFQKEEDDRYQPQHDRHQVENDVKYKLGAMGQTEFESWVDSKVKELGITQTEKIFRGYTDSGNRRYLPHNLDNVVQIMKKGFSDAEGFNYGVGSIRALAGKRFRTLEAIGKDRDKIISKEEMEKVKKEVDDEFLTLEEEAHAVRENRAEGFGRLAAFSDDMKAMAEGGAENWKYLREMYPTGSENGMFQKMREFLEKLKNLPSEYFEAKVQRAVGLHEFTGAAVPEGTPQDLIDALQKRGLDVKTYPSGGSEADRTEARRIAVKDIAESNRVAFSLRSEKAFYSRLTRTVEESQQGKASGAQWKALIKNSKLGANADEFALVGVGDLEDGKTYTKQEVLDYLKANEIQVKDVTLGGSETQDVSAWWNDEGGANEEKPWDDLTSREKQEAIRRYQHEVSDYNDDSTHFSQYQLAGAKEGSYREVLLTTPEAHRIDTTVTRAEARDALEKLDWLGFNNFQEAFQAVETHPDYKERWDIPESEAATIEQYIQDVRYNAGRKWSDGHSQYSSIVNPIVRLRLNERTTADGKRMLFLEEVQAPQKGQFEKMPALFQKNWREIAFKWALRHAAENDFDGVGWTTGKQQADRYSLEKQVDEVSYEKNADGTIGISVFKGGDVVAEYDKRTPSQLEDIIGKDLTRKIADSPEKANSLTGADLKIGGEGLKKLYDQDFRNVVNNLPAGQKVGMAEIRTPDGEEKQGTVVTQSDDLNDYSSFDYKNKPITRAEVEKILSSDEEAGGEYIFGYPKEKSEQVHALELTPEIRDAVLAGQSLFSLGNTEPSRKPRPDANFRGKTISELKDFIRLESGLPAEHQRLLLAFLDSPVGKYAEGLKLRIADILAGDVEGSYFRRVIDLARNSGKDTPAHEFLHHIWELIPDEMQEELETLRVAKLSELISEASDPGYIKILENLRDNPTNGTSEYIKRNVPKSLQNLLYPLSNANEMLANFGSLRFREGLEKASQNKGLVKRALDFLTKIVDAIRRAVGDQTTDERINRLLDKILKGEFKPYDFDAALNVFESERQGSLRATTDEKETVVAQIKNAATEVSRLAEPKVKELQSAASKLTALDYDNTLFKSAIGKLRGLVDYGRTVAMQQGKEIALSPLGKNLAFNLESLGIDAKEVEELQGAIRIENRAVRQANRLRQREVLLGQIASIEDGKRLNLVPGLNYEEAIGVFKEQLEELEATIKRVGKKDAIGKRAAEIFATDKQQPELEAKRNALYYPEVQKIVGDIESGKSLMQQFGEQALSFAEMLKNENATEREKISAGNAILDAIYGLKKLRDEFASFAEARKRAVLKEINQLESQRATQNIRSGLGEVMYSQALETMAGARGLPGNLQDRKRIEALRSDIEATKSFARSLRSSLETSGALAWIERLIAPDAAQGEPITPENIGVSKEAFDRIKWALQISPSFKDAVQALILDADARLENLPVTKIERLEKAIDGGDKEGADIILATLLRLSKRQTSRADAAVADINRKLYQLGVESKSLDEAVGVFDTALGNAGNPNRQLEEIQRQAIDATASGRRMVMNIGNVGGDPKSNASNSTTYVGFGNQPEIVVYASDSLLESKEKFDAVNQWFESAEDYIMAYWKADEDFKSGLSDKSPEELGMDRRIALGLDYAIINQKPIALDGSANVAASRIDVNWLALGASAKALFRQMQVGLQAATRGEFRDVFGKLAIYANARLSMGDIIESAAPKLVKLRARALKAHPELDNNLERYQREVMTPLGTIVGRQFNSKRFGVGKSLGNGQRITQADIDLFKFQAELGEKTISKISESNEGRGIHSDTAIRGIRYEEGKNISYSRRAGAVGDLSVSRHESKDGEEASGKMLRAHTGEPPLDSKTIPSLDIGYGATHKVIKFWNEYPRHVMQHILDSEIYESNPGIMAVKRSPLMLKAQQALANVAYEKNGLPDLKTLEDFVTALSSPDIFPADSGLDVSAYVKMQLIGELEQYFKLKSGENNSLQSKEAQNTGLKVGNSLRNEFNTPMGKFYLPSSMFAYGALTDGDLMSFGNRALSDRIVDFAAALDRAIASASYEQNILKEGKISNYTDDEDRLIKILDVLGKLRQDFDDLVSHQPERGGLSSTTFGLLKSIVLGNPLSGFTNYTAGQMMVYEFNKKISRYGKLLALLHQLYEFTVKIPILIAKQGLGAGYGISKGAIRFINGDGKRDFESLVRFIREDVANQLVTSAVTQTGFSSSIPFGDALAMEWRRVNQFNTLSEQHAERGLVKKVRRITRAAINSAALPFNRHYFGTQKMDAWLNLQGLYSAKRLVSDLQKVAFKYAKRIEKAGGYDPKNPDHLITPGEYGRRLTGAGNKQLLAEVRLALQKANLNLETLLLDYAKSEGKAPMLKEHEMLDLARAAMREVNAKDFTNSPIQMKTNPVFGAISTFWPYASDFFLKFLNSFSTSKKSSKMDKLAHFAPHMVSFAIAAVLFGQLAAASRKEWDKWLFGKNPTNTTFIDDEFWSNHIARNKSLATGSIYALPVIGDAVALILGQTYGNRGFSPSGKVFLFSAIDSLINAGRGFATDTPRFQDRFIPLGDEFGKYFKYLNIIRKIVSPEYESRSGYLDGVGALRSGAVNVGLDPTPKGGQFQGGFTASTGVMRRIESAMMSHDSAGLKSAFNELVEYHRQNKSAEPERSAFASLSTLNPVAKANANRKPTEEEINRIMASMPADQRKKAQEVMDAYSWAVESLGKKEPTFFRREKSEFSGTGRSGGGSGFGTSGGGGSSSSSGGGLGITGKRRRLSLGASPSSSSSARRRSIFKGSRIKRYAGRRQRRLSFKGASIKPARRVRKIRLR